MNHAIAWRLLCTGIEEELEAAKNNLECLLHDDPRSMYRLAEYNILVSVAKELDRLNKLLEQDLKTKKDPLLCGGGFLFTLSYAISLLVRWG